MRITIVTCFSAFILGFINAHTLLFEVYAFVSPQTGNLVNMAVRLVQGDIEGLLLTFVIFGGFFVGCFIATGFVGRIKKAKPEFYIQWSMFYVPLVFILVFFYFMPLWVVIFIKSFISGVALCFFRRIGDIETNNSIVTGNMRFIGGSLFDMFVRKDKGKRAVFISYTAATFLFFLGAVVLTLISELGRADSLLVLLIIGALPYLIGIKLAND